MSTVDPNPLLEAEPTSLQDLFDKDPLSLTDDDIERVVKEQREQRGRWQKTLPKGRGKTQLQELSLEDLGV